VDSRVVFCGVVWPTQMVAAGGLWCTGPVLWRCACHTQVSSCAANSLQLGCDCLGDIVTLCTPATAAACDFADCAAHFAPATPPVPPPSPHHHPNTHADPRTPYNRKCAFDAGDYGLGFAANSLQLGCDCLGDVTYFDGVVNNARGEAVVIRNAVCLHEEDHGLLWKHVDYRWVGGGGVSCVCCTRGVGGGGGGWGVGLAREGGACSFP
jgi:hypothetical protein